jgi:hypothetical protein
LPLQHGGSIRYDGPLSCADLDAREPPEAREEYEKAWSEGRPMSFRIDRFATEDDRVIVRISGRVGAKNLDVLQSVLEEGRIVAIDLKDVLLIDEDAVKLLIAAQANGIELRNCTAYIREWITRERSQTSGEETQTRA